MENISLRSTTQGIRGGKNKNASVGYAAIQIMQKGQSMCDISVDSYEGYGDDYKEREQAIITISFHDGVTIPFHGTTEELKKKLTA